MSEMKQARDLLMRTNMGGRLCSVGLEMLKMSDEDRVAFIDMMELVSSGQVRQSDFNDVMSRVRPNLRKRQVHEHRRNSCACPMNLKRKEPA